MCIVMRAAENGKRGVGRVLLIVAGRVLGTIGAGVVIGASMVLFTTEPLKHRFVWFVALLVVGALLVVSAGWVLGRGERRE
jgi:hypothetical protein